MDVASRFLWRAAQIRPVEPIVFSLLTPQRGARSLALDSADGVELHASLFAAPLPRAGLLLVHGLQSHAGWFEASGTAQSLTSAGITSLAYDRRGSGRSQGEPGHAESSDDFLRDLDAAVQALRAELGTRVPLHVLANCFGVHATLAYAADHPEVFHSLILTAPGTHMQARASYDLVSKIRIALASPETPFPTPLRDEYFVSRGPWLDWIRQDPLSLRTVTAGFLRSAAKLAGRSRAAVPRLQLPALVALGRRDALVDNAAIRRSFVGAYRGPRRLLEYDADHYIDFTESRLALAREIETWLSRPRT